MNVFWRELRAGRKSLIIWMIAIVLLLVISMAKFSTLESGGVDVKQLLDQFPATIQAVFGMNGLDITSVIGYFGILFLYVAIMLAIQAGMLGANLLSKEEDDNTAEFLYAKTISRQQVVASKICAGLINILILNVVVITTSIILAAQHTDVNIVLKELFLFAVAQLILQLVFFFVGMALAASSMSKHASKIIAGLVFAAYILYVLVKIQPKLQPIASLSPLVHFDAKNIIANQTLDGLSVFVLGIVIIASLALIFRIYPKRDLRV